MTSVGDAGGAVRRRDVGDVEHAALAGDDRRDALAPAVGLRPRASSARDGAIDCVEQFEPRRDDIVAPLGASTARA